MKQLLLLIFFSSLPVSLTSCGAIVESMIDGLVSGGDDDDYHESRDKSRRRAQYRSEGKPTIHSID